MFSTKKLAKLARLSLTLFRKISYRVFPPTCILCHGSATDFDLCEHCQNYCNTAAARCYQCALPIPVHEATLYCGQCLKHAPLYERSIALFDYAPPVDELLNQLKFNQRITYSEVLGRLMTEKLLDAYKDFKLPLILIPIPLHPKRLRKRGFNQALELARPIAKKLGLKLAARSIERIINTEQQSLLPAKKRLSNLRGAFKVMHPMPEYVALIDDIVTTGSTINACCEALRKAGVKRIDVWCIARTSL